MSRTASGRTISVLTDDEVLGTSSWQRRLGALDCSVEVLSPDELTGVRPRGPAVVVLLAAGERALHCATVVRQLRARSDVPVLVATESGAERHAVEAIRNGATSFLPLPYEPVRLEEALCALGQREAEHRPTVLRTATLVLDADRREVHHQGRPVPLPRKEFDLLRVLMENADRVVEVEDLLEQCWGSPERTDRSTNSLVVHVKRIRRRLGDDPSSPRLLVSVRGVGYRLADEPV